MQSLRKMAHIRSYFGIEREFNRYYERLRNQLRDPVGNSAMDGDPIMLEVARKRTYERNYVWNMDSSHGIKKKSTHALLDLEVVSEKDSLQYCFAKAAKNEIESSSSSQQSVHSDRMR